MVSVAKHVEALPGDIKQRYKALIHDNEFLRMISSATTDEDAVKRRLRLAEQKLFQA
jgi:hypothetical protein